MTKVVNDLTITERQVAINLFTPVFDCLGYEPIEGNARWYVEFRSREVRERVVTVIFQSSGLPRGKCRIVGQFPVGQRRYTPKNDVLIHVNPGRGTNLLVGDIKKRLLDWYHPALDEAIVQMNKEDQNERAAQTVRRDFANMVGYRLHSHNQKDHSVRAVDHNLQDLIVNHDGTAVSLSTYDIPTHLAKKIVQLLVEHKNEK